MNLKSQISKLKSVALGLLAASCLFPCAAAAQGIWFHFQDGTGAPIANTECVVSPSPGPFLGNPTPNLTTSANWFFTTDGTGQWTQPIVQAGLWLGHLKSNPDTYFTFIAPGGTNGISDFLTLLTNLSTVPTGVLLQVTNIAGSSNFLTLSTNGTQVSFQLTYSTGGGGSSSGTNNWAVFTNTGNIFAGGFLEEQGNLVVTNGSTGVTLAGAFSGNGSGMSNLNAANLTGGPWANAYLTGAINAGSEIISNGLTVHGATAVIITNNFGGSGGTFVTINAGPLDAAAINMNFGGTNAWQISAENGVTGGSFGIGGLFGSLSLDGYADELLTGTLTVDSNIIATNSVKIYAASGADPLDVFSASSASGNTVIQKWYNRPTTFSTEEAEMNTTGLWFPSATYGINVSGTINANNLIGTNITGNGAGVTNAPIFGSAVTTNANGSYTISGGSIAGSRIAQGSMTGSLDLGITGVRYALFGASLSGGPQSSETNASAFYSGVVLLTNFWVSIQPALGAGTNVGFCVRTNGVSTGLTNFITSSTTGSSSIDTTHWAWATNCILDIQITTTLTTAVTDNQTWTCGF